MTLLIFAAQIPPATKAEMPKRKADGAHGSAKLQSNGVGGKIVAHDDDEMGEFEDRWEDEVESEDEVDGEAGEDQGERRIESC